MISQAPTGVAYATLTSPGRLQGMDAWANVPKRQRGANDVIILITSGISPEIFRAGTTVAERYPEKAMVLYRAWTPKRGEAPNMEGMRAALIEKYGQPSYAKNEKNGMVSLQWHFAPDGSPLTGSAAEKCRTDARRRDVRREVISARALTRRSGALSVNVVSGCGVSAVAETRSDRDGNVAVFQMAIYDHAGYLTENWKLQSGRISAKLKRIQKAKASGKANKPKL